MIKKIITHDGISHFDDVFSVFMLYWYFKKNIPIERRDPTLEDLSDPDIWVIDTGGFYDESKNNYDHHHNTILNSSFVLIAKRLDLHKQFKRYFPWYSIKNTIDCKGIDFVAKDLNIDSSILRKTSSPIELFIIRWFALQPEIVSETIGVPWIQSLIDHTQKISTNLDIFDKLAEVIELKEGIGIVKIPIQEVEGIRNWTKNYTVKNRIKIIGSATHSIANSWKLISYDTNVLNFNKCNSNEVKFIHSNGYLLITNSLTDDYMQQIWTAYIT